LTHEQEWHSAKVNAIDGSHEPSVCLECISILKYESSFRWQLPLNQAG